MRRRRQRPEPSPAFVLLGAGLGLLIWAGFWVGVLFAAVFVVKCAWEVV